MTASGWAGTLLFIVLAALCAWLLFRIVFDKDASATVRFSALGITLVLWHGAIETALSVTYNLSQQITFLFFAMNGSVAGRSIPRSFDDFASKFFPELGRVPVFQLLLCAITLILLVRALNALQSGSVPQFLKPLGAISSVVWLNALILGIFFAGIYLSVASLCTIPALQINQPFTEAERAQINAQIDAYSPTEDAFNKQFPENPPDQGDELANLRNLLAAATGDKIEVGCQSQGNLAPIPNSATAQKRDSAVGASATEPAKTPDSGAERPDPKVALLRQNTDAAAEITRVIRLYDSGRCDQLHSYQAMRMTVKQVEQSESEKVKNQINSNFALRLTGRDRADYTYTLEANYQDIVSQMQAALSRCKSAAQASNPAASYGQYLESSLQAAAEHPQAGGDQTYGLHYYEGVIGRPGGPSTEVTACSIDPIERQSRSIAPAPQLGIFSFFFGWLEDSDSLALAIISGMLGVGLVGCIVSSFVRQHAKHEAGTPWIADIFPIIVRGFTAAIVVYLAIEGGLNIFSTENSQANPYVLLFSCLIGAVFSEDVWVAAHKRLESAAPTLSPADKPPSDKKVEVLASKVPTPDDKRPEDNEAEVQGAGEQRAEGETPPSS